jgi:phage-related protein
VRVWGLVRAAANGSRPTVVVQARRGRTGAFKTVRTVAVKNSRGYFVTSFLARRSGAVRLAWTSPSGEVVLSREAAFSLRRR